MILSLVSALGLLALIALMVSAVTLLVRVYLTDSYAEAFVLAIFGLVISVGVISELLHWLGAFRVEWIRLIWAALLVICAGWVWITRKRVPPARLRLATEHKVIYGSVGLLFAITLATGLLVAPNNWDSLTYHLTRAAHWLQNGNLNFFVTSNARQNVITPLPDLVIAHLMAFDVSAHLVTLGQWLSGVAIVTSIGLIANYVYLGSKTPTSNESDDSSRHQSTRVSYVACAVALAATVPMLLSQMSTTQVDLIAGLPVAVATVSMTWVKSNRFIAAALLLGLALSASLAIKATSMVLLAPLALVIAYQLARRGGVKPLLLVGLTTFFSAVALSGRHLWLSLTSDEGAASTARAVFNRTFGVDVVVTNFVRYTASSIQSPLTTVNTNIQESARGLLETLGFNADLPAATYSGGQFSLGAAWSEDHVSALFHMALLVLALLVFVLGRGWRLNSRLAWLVGLSISTWVLMSALIRWQPWVNRFTFLIVVFAMPLAAWLVLRLNKWVARTVLLFFLTFGFAWVLLQPLRGLAGTSWLPSTSLERFSVPSYDTPLSYSRFEQLFMHHPTTAETYQDAMDYLSSLNTDGVQLVIGGDDWEYPIWYWVKTTNPQVAISHLAMLVESPTAGPMSTAPQAPNARTAVICVGDCDQLSPSNGELFESDSVRKFVTEGPPTRSVERGPEITVGLLRAK